jgi:hypothetical protein
LRCSTCHRNRFGCLILWCEKTRRQLWKTWSWLAFLCRFNNWDGNYEVILMTKATLKYTGEVTWSPPSIYVTHRSNSIELSDFSRKSFRENSKSSKLKASKLESFLKEFRNKNQQFVKISSFLCLFQHFQSFSLIFAVKSQTFPLLFRMWLSNFTLKSSEFRWFWLELDYPTEIVVRNECRVFPIRRTELLHEVRQLDLQRSTGGSEALGSGL